MRVPRSSTRPAFEGRVRDGRKLSTRTTALACLLLAGRAQDFDGASACALLRRCRRTCARSARRNFASRHSLRFPRVHRVRWDKAPTDIQTDAELWHIVESNKGAIIGAPCCPVPAQLPELLGNIACKDQLFQRTRDYSNKCAIQGGAVRALAGIC